MDQHDFMTLDLFKVLSRVIDEYGTRCNPEIKNEYER